MQLKKTLLYIFLAQLYGTLNKLIFNHLGPVFHRKKYQYYGNWLSSWFKQPVLLMKMDGATSLKIRQVCSCTAINPRCLYMARN